ncbi:MAG: NfeD family protein [Acidimicrobiales bacterium]
MDEPEVWRWIWLVGAVVLALGEMAFAGNFFLLPFAIGAAVAAVLAFAGVNVGIEWLAFLGLSMSALAALRPLARRLDQTGATEGIGSKRLIGEPGRVLEDIPSGPHESGMVRVHREEWRAESTDGSRVPAGALIRVVDQRGTRLVVHPTPPAGELPEEA